MSQRGERIRRGAHEDSMVGTMTVIARAETSAKCLVCKPKRGGPMILEAGVARQEKVVRIKQPGEATYG